MSTKRTIINADEELVIKGKLTIEGNVTQIETTQQVTNLEGNVFTINSDSSNTSAVLALNSNGTIATMTFAEAEDKLVVNKTIVITAFGNIETTGNVNAGWFHGDGSNIKNISTSIVSEGSNLYFTAARVRGNISVVDTGGDGSLTYNSTTGIFTFTGPSAGDVRVHFSGTNGIDYSNVTGVISLANTTAGNGLTYTNGVLAVGAGDGITVNSDNVAVNNTVIRITGDQTITGNTSFIGETYVTGNIIPTTSNVHNLGSWENHFDYVFANVLHAEYLDLQDANISDIHARFFAGNVAGPYLTTNTAGGLVYTHNATAAGYQINPGDGLQLVSNTVAVDNTVVRTSGSQSIAGEKTFTDDVAIQGNLDVTGNINSLTQVDLFVTDTKITLANGSVSNVDAYIYVEGNYTNNPYIKWDQASSSWTFTNDGSNTYPIPFTTTELGEGTNLYFTSGRVNTAIDAYIVGGDGLTYVSGNISVGQGDGITVNADNVSVDSSVVRTSSNQSISGVKTFTGELVVPSITTALANNSIYVNPSSNSCFIMINGLPVQLTADSDIGQVESLSNVGISIYAGFRTVPIDNVDIYYHGIRSIDNGTYLTSNLASNVITIDANISAIRSEFSTANVAGYGNISYNSSNGLFSYAGVTDPQIRSLFSGTGLISYDSANGVISTTADNYSSWSVLTDSGNGAIKAITSGETLTIQSGTGITVTNTGNVITITNSSTADITGVSAGNGLVGGGNTGDVTLDITAGDGITVNADNVAVNVAYIRNQFSANSPLSYNASTGVFSIGEIGDIESVTAGNGLVGGGNSGNITLDIVGGDGLIVNTDNVVVNAAYVKGLISVTDTGGDGSLTYDNANGIITYTGPSQAESNSRIDARLSGTNGINYSTGVISLANTTAGAGLTYTNGVLDIGNGTGITVNADNVAVNATYIKSLFSATDAGGDGSFSYNDGVFTYTGPSQSEANARMDAYLVGGSGLTYSSGTFNVGAGNYINVGANDVSVNASTTATADTVVARDASGNVYANVFVGVSTSARYADLAENYLADGDYLPGTVLVFGGEEEVTAATTYDSTRVAGVVTTQPAHVMNSHLTGDNVACIALRGRVPVKVKGVVRKGDVLVTAGEGFVGYAVAALYPRDVPAAAMVGKAISDKLDNGPGVVEALI
jgi:hypothetical protein